ncbi:ATP-dependent zinc protease [Marinobacterium maritimum]|uniref:ATP-dependent zinc protease n=2 Tax=Marinobacterium maritimum TaxID=500162 RepID=A0ABP3TDE9_9GAMM
MDTGARTSCIHAFEVEPFDKDGAKWVRFSVHPVQGCSEHVITCEAEVIDFRPVTDSGGHREMRYVIKTIIEFNNMRWPAEFTLTNRDTMKFRMLVGRTTMNGRLAIDPSLSYQLSIK